MSFSDSRLVSGVIGRGVSTGDNRSHRMSWLVNLGFISDSDHFISCLLIFMLHYSPQLPSTLFKFDDKPLETESLVSYFNRSFNHRHRHRLRSPENGVVRQERLVHFRLSKPFSRELFRAGEKLLKILSNL